MDDDHVHLENKLIQATTRCATLFGYIKEKKWDDLLHKLDYYESDASEWIEEKNDDGTTRWRSLLIHLVRLRLALFEMFPFYLYVLHKYVYSFKVILTY